MTGGNVMDGIENILFVLFILGAILMAFWVGWKMLVRFWGMVWSGQYTGNRLLKAQARKIEELSQKLDHLGQKGANHASREALDLLRSARQRQLKRKALGWWIRLKQDFKRPMNPKSCIAERHNDAEGFVIGGIFITIFGFSSVYLGEMELQNAVFVSILFLGMAILHFPDFIRTRRKLKIFSCRVIGTKPCNFRCGVKQCYECGHMTTNNQEENCPVCGFILTPIVDQDDLMPLTCTDCHITRYGNNLSCCTNCGRDLSPDYKS